ncbi:MAG: DUF1656 domain-containing protein [Verrucomicrobia bacterium]|nr:DUF1656 domain-containing protein [Verrucomicrobiota bacterium]
MAINLRTPELDFLDLLLPWSLGIGIVGFLSAWVVMTILERTGLTRFVWHVPLFFLGLFVLLASLLGFLFHP